MARWCSECDGSVEARFRCVHGLDCFGDVFDRVAEMVNLRRVLCGPVEWGSVDRPCRSPGPSRDLAGLAWGARRNGGDRSARDGGAGGGRRRPYGCLSGIVTDWRSVVPHAGWVASRFKRRDGVRAGGVYAVRASSVTSSGLLTDVPSRGFGGRSILSRWRCSGGGPRLSASPIRGIGDAGEATPIRASVTGEL